jgi:hypothetical protein
MGRDWYGHTSQLRPVRDGESSEDRREQVGRGGWTSARQG